MGGIHGRQQGSKKGKSGSPKRSGTLDPRVPWDTLGYPGMPLEALGAIGYSGEPWDTLGMLRVRRCLSKYKKRI